MRPKTAQIFKTLLVILPMALIFYLASSFFGSSQPNTVARVFDGDTFELENGDKIRLWGVDAPERGLCGSTEATNTLQRLILNREVKIKSADVERYNRSLSLVYLGETLVNAEILRSGWAYYDGSAKPEQGRLREAYQFARANRLGVYSDLCYQKTNLQNPGCNIKGNIDKPTDTKTYHLPVCREYSSVVVELNWGEQWFCTETEAQAAGFQKATHCP